MAGAIVIWFCINLLTSRTRLIVYSPDLHLGIEAGSAFARLFGVLVLVLVAIGPSRQALLWTAFGFGILATSGLVFGVIPPLRDEPLTLNAALYISKFLWLVAGILLLIGLVPQRPPTLSRNVAIVLAIAIFLVPIVVALAPIHLPLLVRPGDVGVDASRDDATLGGLTIWHWVTAAVPLGIAAFAVVAAATRRSRGLLDGWLLIAIILFAGSQLHDILVPSAYGPIITVADILELASAAIVCVAGIVELQRFGVRHATLLDLERESTRNLRELSILKSDFTAMIAHELGNPLAAIRRQADVLSRDGLDPSIQQQAVDAIQTEARLLAQLVLDVQESARVERADFDVVLRPYPVDALLVNAAAFGRSLPGHHDIVVNGMPDRVIADPERIGQVLRNLVDNASKYSDAGEPIQLRAVRVGDRVRFQVIDQGPGISEPDARRVFGKFERGMGATREIGRNRGLGLGLYLASRIVTLHGGTLSVDSGSNAGSTFSFDLEVAE